MPLRIKLLILQIQDAIGRLFFKPLICAFGSNFGISINKMIKIDNSKNQC